MNTSTKVIFLGIALSLSLSSCATAPTTPSVSESNRPNASALPTPSSSSSSLNPSTPGDRQDNTLKLVIQGDVALQGFAVKQAQQICLDELRTLDIELNLPASLDSQTQAALEAQGVSFTDAKNLRFSFAVNTIQNLIDGFSKILPDLPSGTIIATTHLNNAVGNTMGSFTYEIAIADGTKEVKILLKPSEEAVSGITCSTLLPEISGAALRSTAGGILATITQAPPSGQNPNPSPTANASVPVARIKINVDSRFLSREGETKQLTATLFDAAGNVLPADNVTLIWSSARPQDVSIDSQGKLKAMVGLGYAPVTVTVAGTNIRDTVAFDISDPAFFTSPTRPITRETPTPTPLPAPTQLPIIKTNALGDSFRVDNATSLTQYLPDIAMDDAGDFVVTWTHLDTDEEASIYGFNIHGQRYNAQGNEIGSEFLVNTPATNITNFSGASSVAMDSDGDFVVAWAGSNNGNQSKYEDLHIQRFNRNGGKEDEIIIAAQTSQQLGQPSVAMDSDGDFVVSWTQFGGQNQQSSAGVYFQRYTKNGDPLDTLPIRVTEPRQGATSYSSAVTMNDSGRFTISWMSMGDGNDVYVQSFSSDGSEIGAAIKVNNQELASAGQSTFVDAQQPSVSMDNAGGFIVAWSSVGEDSGHVYAQRFNSSAQKQGNNFTVSDNTNLKNSFADVALDSDGDFVVSWSGTEPETQNKYGMGGNVYAKTYNKQGEVQGETLNVSSQQPNSIYSGVALNDDGDLAFAWQSLIDENQSGEKYNVYARRYKLTSGNN